MRKEIEILVLAMHESLAADEEARLSTLVHDGQVDWEFLNRAAIAHKICPPLEQLLVKLEVPASQFRLISQESREIQRKSMMLMARLFRLQDRLDSEGLQFAFVKGAVITDLLYGSLKKRTFCDIDLFVREGDVAKVGDILISQGFSPTKMWCRCPHSDQFFTSPVFLKLSHEKEYTSANDSFAVDLHWGTGSWFATTKQMIDHTVEYKIKGAVVTTLEANLHFIYLCAHAAKHDWCTLLWIADIDRALRSKAFNWRKVERLSRKLGMLKTVQLSVGLAVSLFNSPTPQPIIRQSRDLENCCAEIISRFDNVIPPVVSHSLLPGWRRNMQIYDSKSQIGQQLLVDLCSPTFSDWVRLPLPENLFWLYSIVRPASKVFFVIRNGIAKLFGREAQPNTIVVGHNDGVRLRF